MFLLNFEKFFLFWVSADEYLEGLKAKLESAYSFMLKYSKITVWVVFVIHCGVYKKLVPYWHKCVLEIFTIIYQACDMIIDKKVCLE